MNITNNFITAIYAGVGIAVILFCAVDITYYALTTFTFFKKRDAKQAEKLEQIKTDILSELKESNTTSNDLLVGGITKMTQESIDTQTQTAKDLNSQLIDALDKYTQTTISELTSQKSQRKLSHRTYHRSR